MRIQGRSTGSGGVGGRTQIHPLVLDRPPQSLDEDVAMAPSASIHADLDAVGLEHVGELLAGKLAALVGVENLQAALAQLSQPRHVEA